MSVTRLEDDAPAVRAAVEDPTRLEELVRTRLLDSPREEAFDRLTRLAARLLDTPIALVSLVDQNRQFFKSSVGANRRETSLEHSYCKYVVANREPLAIEDAWIEPLQGDGPAGATTVLKAYAGIPLVTSNGHILGAFCVIDNHGRTWDEADLAVLRDLAAMVVTEIDYRLKLQDVEELTAIGGRLVEPLRGLSDYLGSLVRLVNESKDPRLEHFAMLADARIRGVESVLHELQAIAPTIAAPAASRGVTDLARPVLRAIKAARVASGTRDVRTDVEDVPMRVSVDSWALEQSVTHLIVAGVHHSSGAPGFHVALRRCGGEAELEVSAPAVIPPGDVARLLSRFHRTTWQGVVPGRDTGVRFRSNRGALEAEYGPLRARSAAGEGTVFTLRLPLLPDDVGPANDQAGADDAGLDSGAAAGNDGQDASGPHRLGVSTFEA